MSISVSLAASVSRAPKSNWVGTILLILLGFGAHGYAQCVGSTNPVVAENCLAGSPSSEWDTKTFDAGDPSIQGFSTDISVNQGGTIRFKIDTNASAYTIDIYRMGYYGGFGARKVTSITPSVPLPQTQPACLSDSSTGLTDCGNWAVSASWQVPANAVSGVYFAHLIRTDTGGDSHIVFIVRNDSSHSDILYQTSDTSWQAYNYYGNGSLYGGGTPVFGLPIRAFEVSYNRPVLTRGFNNEAATYVFGAEFAMIQWLESNGYDVTYSSGIDTVRNGALIKNHKIFMDSGHDEYVSAEARSNIEAARDAGVNLAFFSGNEVFWKTRWQNSIDGTNTPYRTIVCYKETLAFAKLDPQDPPTWTGTWRDPTFSPPADGGRPENALTGTLFMVDGTADDNPGNQSIKVPAEDGKMRFWRNTEVATLAPGATYTLVPGSLGYEWDVDADNGFRPAGAFRLSTTTYTLTTDYLLDFGATYGAGTATHHLMTYRAPSGALVFGAGTVDWAFGLNSNHDNPFNYPTPDPDVNMQQATVNLLADMGSQPATLQPGLRIASKSTDTVPPHSTILTPVVGSNISTGSSITITGIASDTGGVVAGVEFSGDGGATWHPASGRSTWSYSWSPTTVGFNTLLSRAVDDSGNLENPGNGVIVNVAPQTCPCTIFGQNVPTIADSGDGNAVELGIKFRADADGNILGVRFYKSAGNTGTHIGHVWTSSGQLLGTATFSAETTSGWQQATFSSPIPAAANTTYIASYYAPAGHYSADVRFLLQSGYDNPPLHALEDGVDGVNGEFSYSTGGGFPGTGSNATNYWVDVIYSSSNTYSISGTITGPGGGGATVTLAGPESLSTLSDASGNYSFDGAVNGTYTVTVSNSGVSFAPSIQTANVNSSSVSGVNFVAVVINPLSISGTISGGTGATVTLAGPADLTTTTDSSGNYSFNGLLNGSYSVTPSAPTYIFNPSTQAVTLAGSSVTNVNFTQQVCTCISIWQPTDLPADIDPGDGAAVEVGVRFTADSPSTLIGLRFYKASTNIGAHVGHLWSNSGQLLGTAIFPSETTSGWQQGYFSSPVSIEAGTPYVASYFAPNGHYSATSNYFGGTGFDRPPLHALADGVSGPDGVYIYSPTGGFPTSSFNSTNYWVDVLYAAVPHTISGIINGAGGAGATVTLSGTNQATTTADASGNFTFTNVFGGSYSITPSKQHYVFVPGNQNISVSETDITGVNFAVPEICPCDTVWQPSAQPVQIDSTDTKSVELGVKVRADSDGYILGVRFYKASTNSGTHIGNLWSTDGTLLATGTFVNESTSGWQQLMFTTPVAVVANTTYVVSYLAPEGHYSADTTFFASKGLDSPPLHALQDGVDGGNGVYSFGATSTFPDSTYNAFNYWVDVIYATTPTYTLAGTITGPGAAGATLQLQGPINATTTSDAQGSFNFNGVVDGSYTVTASKSGFIYSPAVLSINITGSENVSANFTSTVQGFVVSGTVAGASGINVTLSGASTQTATTDGSGNFTLASVPNGTYTVTPSGKGIIVTPVSQTITVNGAAVSNVNFTTVVSLFTISGTITGPGGSGATVTLTGPASASTTANSTGVFTFSGIPNGTYLVAVGQMGFVYTPQNQSVVLNGSNAAVSFSSAAQTFTLSGTISGIGAGGATVTLTGGSTATTTSSASGAFSFAGLANGMYTVAVSNAGYVFTPASQSATIRGTNVSVTFTSAAQTFSLSGMISGPGANGTTINLSGASTATTATDTTGAYSFPALAKGSYTVTPTKPGIFYTPATQTVVLTGNATANFVSAPLSNPGEPGVIISPTALAFGSHVVGAASSSETLTLTNTGSATLTPLSINVTGTNSSDFTQTNTCSMSLPAGASCAINVTFDPSAAGSRSASIQISDNAASSPQIAGLSGTGTSGLGLGVAPGSPLSVSVTGGSPANYTLSIGGAGFSGTASLTCSGAPQQSICSVPGSVTVSANKTTTILVTVTTTAGGVAELHLPMSTPLVLSASALALLFLPRRLRGSAWLRIFGFLSLTAATLSLSGCASVVLFGTGGRQQATPSGSYTLTVSASAGSMTDSTQLTLIVR
jgi:Domain of unknown function (DUF4082)/Bacterial Ig domain/Abnormal spindle-like microcephaly-assoc'd, ASPM-SPD-2-Hydin